MAIKYTSDADFDKDVKQSKGVVLVDFYADWCGPCRALGEELKKLDAEHGDKVQVVKIDVDQNQGEAQKHGVRGIPALALYKDGDLVGQTTGARPKAELVKWINDTLGTTELSAAPNHKNDNKGPKFG